MSDGGANHDKLFVPAGVCRADGELQTIYLVCVTIQTSRVQFQA